MGSVKGYRKGGTDWDKLWQSMRILRRFCAPDLIRTAVVKSDNTHRFLRCLLIHGIIAKEGRWTPGYPGVYQQYRLVRETPKRPVQCTRCGGAVSDPECLKCEEERP